MRSPAIRGVTTSPRYIFHITGASEWSRAQAEGAYHGSTRGLTLDQVGFVHCAGEEQVARVANAFFGGVPGLVVLRIAIDRLNAELRFEDLAGGGDAYPHVYGPLNLDAVDAIIPLAAGADGVFTFPYSSSRQPMPAMERVRRTASPA